MKNPKDERFMREAIDIACQAADVKGASPIGCITVRDGAILATAFNEVEGRGDPTAHAEILAIRRACEATGDVELRNAILYSTLEPCGMCSMASIWAKLGRIVYGAGHGDVHRMYFEDRHLQCRDFIKDAFRDDLALEGGICVESCAALYPDPDDPIPESGQANL